ncbi:MAG: PDZ domain-containing protein [Akkermansiaceae bacterium]|jgi:serine protease Do
MKTFLFTTSLLTAVVSSQLMPPEIPEADRKVTSEQAGVIFKALRAVNFEAKKVVFPIFSGPQRLAYGISIGEGRLLAKASEVAVNAVIYTVDSDRKSLRVTIEGAYPEHDLVVLNVPDLKAPAAKWADASELAEGTFLTAIRPDGEAQAMGVLSVQERSLRTADQGFLGIQMDPRAAGKGVRVEAVVPGSAADDVGIEAGDVITKVTGEEVKGFFELSNRLRRLKSGENPEIQLIRGEREFAVTPTLQGREISEQRSGRLDLMDRMSGTRSQVRGNFANVMQSDMELEASDSGLPVVDLDGRMVGMVIAREGRISTLILPGDDLAKIIAEKPQPLTERRQASTQPPAIEIRRERMRRELDEMKRMMEQLQDELNRE